MTTLDTAHDYIRRGWAIVPLHGFHDGRCLCRLGPACPEKNRGKHPSRGNEWQNRLLTSGADVHAWWDERPDDNLGVATGAASGLWVLDLDGAPGIRTLTEFAAEHGALPPTRIVRTGSGGLHYYWRHPGHFTVHNSSGWLGPGVDIRGKGGQVVAPPSVSGRGPYEVLADHPVAEAPEWLLHLVREHSDHCEAGRSAEVKTAERVDLEFLPPRVRDLASMILPADTGRFRHFHALVAACYEHGYSQGQAVTIAAPWCVAVDKFVGRVEAEVARCWGKLEADAARQNEWIDGIAGPTATAQPDPVAAPAAPDPTDDAPADADTPDLSLPPPSWRPVDLTPILSGTYAPETPTILPRTDGHCLLYPGRIHSFHGESESGKSLVAQAETARLIQTGHDTLYIDFESDAAAVVTRLRELGCGPDAIAERFTYLRPDTDPRKFPHEREALSAVLTKAYALAVVDGVTDALGVFGASSKDNDDISAFMRAVPRLIANRTGAAVVLIDHVTKDSDNRGRFAIGGQAKMASLDGSAFVVEVAEAIGRGMRGKLTLRIAKDRPGGVRPHSGDFRKNDRTQEAACIVVDSTGSSGLIEVTVEPPRHTVDSSAGARQGFRPTVYMERVSQFVERAAGPVRHTTVVDGVSGDDKRIREALATLVAEGFMLEEEVQNDGRGPRTVTTYTLNRAYSQAADPLSDAYVGWAETAPPETPVNTGETPVAPQVGYSGGAPPPLRGGTGVSGPHRNSKTDTPVEPATPELDPELQVSCEGCFRPVGQATAKGTGGLCPKCVGEGTAAS